MTVRSGDAVRLLRIAVDLIHSRVPTTVRYAPPAQPEFVIQIRGS